MEDVQIRLITGHTGKNHITADDDASKLSALIGRGEYVLDVGTKFKYDKVSNNQIDILDGDAIFQGRHCRVSPDMRISCDIGNGTQNQYRNDLIGIKYKRIGAEESAWIAVIQGTPGTVAEDPSYTTGNIEEGATEHFMPLYRVTVDGVSAVSIVPLYKVYNRIPNFSFGTADPTGGEDGDVYFKIIE